MARTHQAVLLVALIAGASLTGIQWPAGLPYLVALTALNVGISRFGGRHRADLLLLATTALLIRVAFAAALQWIVPQLAIGQSLMSSDPRVAEAAQRMGVVPFGDEWQYEQAAWGVAQLWTRAGEFLANGSSHLLVPGIYLQATGEAFGMKAGEAAMYLLPHVYVDAVVYTVVGREPVAGRIAHAAIASLLPVLVYLLALDWFGVRAARVAGWAAVVEPSLILWAPWMLKDMWVVSLIALLLFAVGGFMRRPSPGWLAALGAFLAVLTPMRGPVAVYLGVSLPLAAVGTPFGKARAAILAVVVLLTASTVLWLGGEGFMGTNRLNIGLPYQMWYMRMAAAQGARTVVRTIDEQPPALPRADDSRPPALPRADDSQPPASSDSLGTVGSLGPTQVPPTWAVTESSRRSLSYLPVALVHVLGAPFPWEISTSKDLLALFCMPSWFAILALAILGAVHGWRQRERLLVLPVVFLVGTVVYLSLTDASVGIIVRHRLMLFPVLLPLAGQGAIMLWDSRSVATRRWRTTTPLRVETS